MPCVNTLFHENIFHSHTKRRSVEVDEGYLSILAASTTDTFQRMWSPTFTDIGFINRLWLVPGKGERKFSVPKPIPEEKIIALKNKLRALVGQPFVLKMTPAAFEIFDRWYMSAQRSIFTKRLDTYGHRLMILFCVNEGKTEITADIAERVISLLDWQLRVRQEYDPIDAEGKIARMEESIRKALVNSQMDKRQLQRSTHYNRYSTFVWKTAVKNLEDADEIVFDKSTGKYKGKNVLGK
ncbi:MAG: hypothetical protein ABSB79_08875 [Syntrophales bacterium]